MDIKKFIDVVSESSAGGTAASSVAPLAKPVGETQSRSGGGGSPDKPEVIEYGMWENSALTTGNKLKERTKSSKVVKSIYGEDASEAENPKQQAAIAIAKKSAVKEEEGKPLQKGSKVRVPHRGKTVDGVVVRHDRGGPEEPFYVVDVGDYGSIKVPVGKVKAQSVSEGKFASGIEGLDLTEGLDPEKRKRLDDLIDQYRTATDPSYDPYGVDDHPPEPEEIIDLVRQEFGSKIADELEAGESKLHFPRPHHSPGYDPLGWKKPVDRQTKAGKMYKQDSDYRKNTIKSRYKLSGKSATEGVAEGSVFDIDTTGYTKNDMDFINHDINQIEKIRAKLLKIPGFARKINDETSQLQLAEKIFNLMKRGQTFDSALVLAQKNPSQKGVAEAKGKLTYTPEPTEYGVFPDSKNEFVKTFLSKDLALAHIKKFGGKLVVLDQYGRRMRQGVAEGSEPDLESYYAEIREKLANGLPMPAMIAKLFSQNQELFNMAAKGNITPKLKKIVSAWGEYAPWGENTNTSSSEWTDGSIELLLKAYYPAWKTSQQSVTEDALEESDLIIAPASVVKKHHGLISQGSSRVDREISMAKADLYQASKNALQIFQLIRHRSELDGLEGWVQEKIIKAADYLNIVREYLEGQELDEADLGPVAQLVQGGIKPEDAAYAVQVDNILKRPTESANGVAPSTKMFTSENKNNKMNTCESCGQKWKFTHKCKEHDKESVEEAKRPGLWANIRAKQERIKNGSGERMRKPGSKGAPTNKQLQSIRKASNESICGECGGPSYDDPVLAEKQDACYHKVKSRYKVWPSAYASGALVKCRKVGAKNWGNKSKK